MQLISSLGVQQQPILIPVKNEIIINALAIGVYALLYGDFMKSKTIHSEKVWQSPDGQKSIWEVMLQAEGTEYKLKTFSPRISQIGFEGDVESYVNPRGDRFVKQRATRSSANSRDQNVIRAQWAIGQSIALSAATMRKDTITMKSIEDKAHELYAMVDRIKTSNKAEIAQKDAQATRQDTTSTGPEYIAMF
jgi:hypothetical protein